MAIELPENIKKILGSEIAHQPNIKDGVVLYIPLYLVIAQPKSEFLSKIDTGNIAKLPFTIYHAVSGKRSDFFENLLRRNLGNLETFLRGLLSTESVDLSLIKLWSRVSSLDEIGNFTVDNDYNLQFHFTSQGVEILIAEANLKALWDIAYNSIFTFSTIKPLGRIVRLETPDELRNKVIDYLLYLREEEFRKQDKSESYIQKQIEILRTRFSKDH